MRIPALMFSLALAALAAGCAPYRDYDHRDAMHRADQDYRPARDVQAARRTASRTPARPRQTSVQRIAKARSGGFDASRRVAGAKPAAPRAATERRAAAPRTPAPEPRSMAEAARPAVPAPPAAAATTPAAPPAAAAAATAAAAVQPAPAKTVAKPAAAAAAPAASVATDTVGPAISDAAARKEIADGYRLLRAGFVKKARERFEAAKTALPGEATLAEARSLDPTYLASVAFPDVQPDGEQAKRLYRRALMLGAAEAKADLDRLEGAANVAEPPLAPGAAKPQ